MHSSRVAASSRNRLIRIMMVVAVVASPAAVPGQGSDPGLVVPVPSASAVEVRVDSFTTGSGQRAAYTVVRPRGVRRPLPLVLFANAGGSYVRSARGYVEWARLVTTRGMAAILYDAGAPRPGESFDVRLRLGEATLDSMLVTVQRTGASAGIDPNRIVLWAGSAQTSVATPIALEGRRHVAGYVLYYGGGRATNPRVDVPVLIARAGLDAPSLNAQLDSLAHAWTRQGLTVTMINHAAGSHGFDIYDRSAATARVIAQTLDFMVASVDGAYRAAMRRDTTLVRAAAAYAAERWSEAASLYGLLSQADPDNRVVAWREGLALLATGSPAEALVSFDRAKALGQGGARDIGLPAARAALRSGAEARAVEWINWALASFANIRQEIAADRELAPLLQHPDVRRP